MGGKIGMPGKMRGGILVGLELKFRGGVRKERIRVSAGKEREGASVRIWVCVGTEGRTTSLAGRSEMLGESGGTGIEFGWVNRKRGNSGNGRRGNLGCLAGMELAAGVREVGNRGRGNRDLERGVRQRTEEDGGGGSWRED